MDELSNHFLFMTNAFKKRFDAQFAAKDPVRLDTKVGTSWT